MRLPRDQFVFFYPFFLPQVTFLYIFYFCLILLQIATLRRTIAVHFNKFKLFLKSNLFLKKCKKAVSLL
jgi:hypothetical protein